jgi:hypothetical protein
VNKYIPAQPEAPTFETDHRNDAAFDRTMVHASALTPEQLRRVTVDIFTAIRTARAGTAVVERMRELIAKQLPLFDLSPLDRMDDTCRALLVAHERYSNESARRAAELPRLEARSIEVRRIALGDLDALASRGVIAAADVAKIREGAGRDDLLMDLNAIDRLLTAAREALGDKLWVTVEEQAYLRATATAFSDALLSADESGKPERDRIETRVRVFTQLVNDYDQVRRLATFALWNEGTVESLVPSLFARGPAVKEESEKKGDAKPQPQPQSKPNALDAMPQPKLDLDPTRMVPQDDPFLRE